MQCELRSNNMALEVCLGPLSSPYVRNSVPRRNLRERPEVKTMNCFIFRPVIQRAGHSLDHEPSSKESCFYIDVVTIPNTWNTCPSHRSRSSFKPLLMRHAFLGHGAILSRSQRFLVGSRTKHGGERRLAKPYCMLLASTSNPQILSGCESAN